MNRIPQIDFFRGFFLIIITTNHFLSWQNIVYRFTYEFIGWITAAEGFVFLSGLTAGIVYSRKLVENGEDFISLAAKKRAWTIYKYHLILFLLVTIIFFSHSFMEGYWYNNYHDFKLIFQKPLFSALLSGILLYQPIYMDILPMYALFILLLPVCLKYFQRGQKEVILVFSFLVYLIGTFDLVSGLFDKLKFLNKVDSGYFNLLSWQLLFVGGLYLGFLTFHNKTSSVLQNRWLLFTAAFICVVLFVFKNVDFLLKALPFDLNYWVSKDNLGPLRLLNFTALLMVMSYLASRYKQFFSFKPISYLGKYSLEVFSLHILLIFIFKPFKQLFNSFYSIKITEGLYINPGSTFMLFLIIIPALFLAPLIKTKINHYKLKRKAGSLLF